MLTVVNAVFKIRTDEGKWCEVTIWDHLKVMEETETQTLNYHYNTFEEFLKDAQEHRLLGCCADTTFFRHRPCVRVHNITKMEKDCITKRSFTSVDVKIEYQKGDWSMKYISEELPADDFARLAKDKGWNIQF